MLLSLTLAGQERYFTESGRIEFEASVPSFEEVRASCDTATSVLDTDSGEIAALVLVKGFRFKIALMEEHFNTHYAESHLFPKATFKGSIKDFSLEDLDVADRSYTMEGILTFHGRSLEIEPAVAISKKGSTLRITTDFIVKLSDFEIELPKLIQKKVAETAKVSVDFKLVPRS